MLSASLDESLTAARPYSSPGGGKGERGRVRGKEKGGKGGKGRKGKGKGKGERRKEGEREGKERRKGRKGESEGKEKGGKERIGRKELKLWRRKIGREGTIGQLQSDFKSHTECVMQCKNFFFFLAFQTHIVTFFF